MKCRTLLTWAKILHASSKLTENGTLNLSNAIGETGTVYILIPASGTGKITMNASLDSFVLSFLLAVSNNVEIELKKIGLRLIKKIKKGNSRYGEIHHGAGSGNNQFSLYPVQ